MENKEKKNLEFDREKYISELKRELERLEIEANYWSLIKNIEENKYFIDEFKTRRAMLALKLSSSNEESKENKEE